MSAAYHPANPLLRFRSIAQSGIEKGLCLAIDGYRLIFGPVKMFFGFQGCCRFTPTCSHYCQQAIREHGALCGCTLGLKRILRCHPWGGTGIDPVPAPPLSHQGSNCISNRSSSHSSSIF